jgi:uncharacterized membrane protein
MAIAMHGPARNRDWLARPNVSMSRRGRRLLFAGIALVSLAIAAAFALLGAWPVLPFAGLELLALALALRHLERHAADYEAVQLRDGRLSVEVRDGETCTREACAACWMRFFLCRPPETGATRLRFRAHGRHVDVGRWMSEEQLGKLASELKETLQPRHPDA